MLRPLLARGSEGAQDVIGMLDAYGLGKEDLMETMKEVRSVLLSCLVLFCHILSCLVLSYLIMPCLALSCLVLSVMSCLVPSYLAFSCYV